MDSARRPRAVQPNSPVANEAAVAFYRDANETAHAWKIALERDSATHLIDATGRVVAPGFIDLHAHLDPLLRLPGAESASASSTATSTSARA